MSEQPQARKQKKCTSYFLQLQQQSIHPQARSTTKKVTIAIPSQSSQHYTKQFVQSLIVRLNQFQQHQKQSANKFQMCIKSILKELQYKDKLNQALKEQINVLKEEINTCKRKFIQINNKAKLHKNIITDNKQAIYTNSKEKICKYSKEKIRAYNKDIIFTDNKQNHKPYIYLNANNVNEDLRNNSKKTTQKLSNKQVFAHIQGKQPKLNLKNNLCQKISYGESNKTQVPFNLQSFSRYQPYTQYHPFQQKNQSNQHQKSRYYLQKHIYNHMRNRSLQSSKEESGRKKKSKSFTNLIKIRMFVK